MVQNFKFLASCLTQSTCSPLLCTVSLTILKLPFPLTPVHPFPQPILTFHPTPHVKGTVIKDLSRHLVIFIHENLVHHIPLSLPLYILPNSRT